MKNKFLLLLLFIWISLAGMAQKGVAYKNLKLNPKFEWTEKKITIKGITKIEGEVVIPKNVVVQNFGAIHLLPGAKLIVEGDIENENRSKIVVQKNAVLLVESTGRIMASRQPKSYKWDGITVNSGLVKVNPGGTVAGMMNGIFLVGGGNLDIDEGKFYGNYTTFNIPNLALGKIINSEINYFPPPNSDIKVGKLFTNSSNDCFEYEPVPATDLFCNHSGLHGIYLTALGNLVEEGDALLEIKGNTFERLVCGIRGDGYTEAIVDENNTFKKCNFGVLMEEHSKIKVDGNAFEVWNWSSEETNTAQMYHLTTENTFGKLPADVSLGDHAGVGIYTTEISQTVTGNTFTGMRPGSFQGTVWGIQIGGDENSLDIQKNTFENLRYSIWLREGEHSFANLRCNVFNHTLAASGGADNLGTGLYVGALGSPSVAPSITGNIGGDGNQSIGNPNPNANVWPKDPNNTSQSPSNWISIQKPDAGGLLNYFKYSNEFVGTVLPNSGSNVVETPPYRSAKSPYFIKNWCDTYHGGNVNSCYTVPTNFLTANPNPWNSSWDAVCENLGDDVEFFARQAVAGDFTITDEILLENQSVLGDPIPNPSAGKTNIPVLWLEESGKLQVFELTSGKVISSRPIRKGRQMVEFELSAWPTGVYGYRLEGEGRCPEPKKLIVIH